MDLWSVSCLELLDVFESECATERSKSVAEGRRVGKHHAVEDPDIEEMAEAMSKLGLDFDAERNKAYSRDWLTKGRLRVALKNDFGALCNPAIPNRKALFLALAQVTGSIYAQ